MIEKLINQHEKDLNKWKSLLNEEISTLERYISSLNKIDFKDSPAYDVSKSTQVDNIASTMTAISRDITRYEMNINKHESILEGLKKAQELSKWRLTLTTILLSQNAWGGRLLSLNAIKSKKLTLEFKFSKVNFFLYNCWHCLNVCYN